MIIAAYILIAAVVLIFVFRPLFASRGELEEATRKEDRRRKLMEDREMLYDSIRELDFDYRMGKVEDDDYKETRSRYQAQAVGLMKTIDQTNGRPDVIEDQIEQEIAALRRSSKNEPIRPATCPDCGSITPPSARFCPQCGKTVGAE
ncbi:MAG: zinc ribbon domain-containing protein [bacterium]|nr:zinc ribbon domain-containing protein [bacterium]